MFRGVFQRRLPVTEPSAVTSAYSTISDAIPAPVPLARSWQTTNTRALVVEKFLII